jgi:hypothetical protein
MGEVERKMNQLILERQQFEIDQKKYQLKFQRQQNVLGHKADPLGIEPPLSAADYGPDPSAQRYEERSRRYSEIPKELELLRQYKLQVEYEFPALSAMGAEKGNTRENNAAIMGRIPEKFDEIRGSISDLGAQIQRDPKVALRLDKVVEQTLNAGILTQKPEAEGARDMLEVMKWLASEEGWKTAGNIAGAVGTTGAVIASVLNPELGILRWIAVGLGIGTAAVQLPDAIIEDRAAQSQRGGAQKVTSLDPDTARGNLTMAWVNLGIAGLDVGLQPEVVTQVVKLPGVAKAAMSMTKAQGKVFVERLAQVKGEVTEAVVEKLAQGIRRGDPEAGAIFPKTDMKQQLLKQMDSAKLSQLQETLVGRGVKANSAKQMLQYAKDRPEVMEAVEILVNGRGKGQLRNPDALAKLVKTATDGTQAGSLRELQIAAERVRLGHEVELGGGADIVDFTAKEAIQLKNVTSPGKEAVLENLDYAGTQLKGTKGEAVPIDASGKIDLLGNKN